jgi:hypothetical protein
MWAYSAPASDLQALTAVDVATGTAAAITDTSLEVREVLLSAPSSNSEDVYVGPDGVTTDDGTPIAPGDRLPIAIDDPAKLYAIAANSGQTLRVLVALAWREPA